MSSYILQTGERGRERLEILNELVNHGFISFVESAGLREGMRVLDIGCGTGILTCEIAKKVGPSGSVIGIDSSEDQIKEARLKAKQEKVPNVSFKVMAAQEIKSLAEEFDFIFTRYVLTHLKKPKEVVKSALSLLAKDGVIVCDEKAD